MRTSPRLKRPTAKATAGLTHPKPKQPAPKRRSSGASKSAAKAEVEGPRVVKGRKATSSKRIDKSKSASMRISRAAVSTSTSSRTTARSAPSSPSSSTSGGRTSTTLVESQSDIPSTSRSASRTPSKRKRAPSDPTPSRTLKRKRVSMVDKDEKLRAREERLVLSEKSVREREAEVKKREAAVVKKNNALDRAAASVAREREAVKKRADTLKSKHREVEAEQKEVAAMKKRLAAEEKILAKRAQRETAVTAVGTISEPQWALAQLEEHFTCSLCYEVMACPYTLSPGRCGHSFCAICIMQWCFAAVHRGCGYWHDSLECPLCRAELPYTSDHTPRSLFSFPFTPNRLADSAIKALVQIVRDATPEPGASTSTGASACTQRGATAAPRESDKLIPWRETGASYMDWEDRDRRGRTEMTVLATEWATLQADDFVAFKDRLGV